MMYENRTLDGVLSAMHGLLGRNFVAPEVPRIRRRLALVGAIERLEGRVVPSTIWVTSVLNSGRGTLRAAIDKANLAAHDRAGEAHGDTIKFAHSVRGTIVLASALPALSADMVISGPGPSTLSVARSDASQTPAFGIFTVGSRAVIKITGLTITGGIAGDGGGISNAGTLSLVDAKISGNSATATNGHGGGIDNSGRLSVTNTTITGNTAGGLGADVSTYGYGGGISNSGTLSVTNSTFSANSATGELGSVGGGIDNSGTLSVTNSTFSANSATGELGSVGGGIDNSGTLSVTNSTFSGNSATGGFDESGGGGIDNSGSLSLVNTTISGNSDTGRNGYGGGIDSSGTLSITNTTISGNSAVGLGYVGFLGGVAAGGGIINSGMLSVTDSTISGNSATDTNFGGSSAGGGIVNSSALSVTHSTFSANSAMGDLSSSGGGISNSGTLSVTNSTFSANSATNSSRDGIGSSGGGISNSGALSVTNSTFSANSALSIVGSSGGGIDNFGTLSVTNATFSGNSAMGGPAVPAARSPTRAPGRSPTSRQTIIRPPAAVASRSPQGPLRASVVVQIDRQHLPEYSGRKRLRRHRQLQLPGPQPFLRRS